VTVRLFNVYGEGEAPHRLLPHLVDRLSRGEPADLTSGTQARDFVHVSDAVEAMVRLATAPHIPLHDSYNVCTGSGTTVRRFAREVAEALGAASDLLRFGTLPQRTDEPPAIIGDPERLARITGWRAALTVPEGIARSLDALRGAGGER
jgi:UDP-glucose 4-epimerase